MPRPLNKSQLLAAIQKEYGALEKFVTTLTAEQLAHAPTPGAWSVKDMPMMYWRCSASHIERRPNLSKTCLTPT